LLTVKIGVPVDHVIWSALRPLFRAAWLDAITVIDALTGALDGSVSSKIVGKSAPPATLGGPSRQPNTTTPVVGGHVQPAANGSRLTELVEAYLIHCEAEDDYATDLRMYARRLQESLGEDRKAQEISKRDMIAFMGQISRLPARLTHTERKLNLQELIASVDAQAATGIARSRLSRKTLEKWFQCLGAMFRFGRLHDFCDVVPTEGIRRPKKKNVEPPRQHFEPDEIQLIFSSPLYRGHSGDAYRCKPGNTIKRDAKYWLPLLALFTGCRRDEMVQARVSDVKEQGGIHFLHITTVSDDGGRQKKVKTASSRRKVPFHKAIVNAGFLDYVYDLRERGELYLFPEIDQTAREPAGAFGKWFDRFCGRLAKINNIAAGRGIDAPTRTFHSYRHTFKRACRDAGISKDIHDELTGHAGSNDVGGDYGRSGDGRFSLSVLDGAIQKLNVEGYVATKDLSGG
jgi:integrase